MLQNESVGKTKCLPVQGSGQTVHAEFIFHPCCGKILHMVEGTKKIIRKLLRDTEKSNTENLNIFPVTAGITLEL